MGKGIDDNLEKERIIVDREAEKQEGEGEKNENEVEEKNNTNEAVEDSEKNKKEEAKKGVNEEWNSRDKKLERRKERWRVISAICIISMRSYKEMKREEICKVSGYFQKITDQYSIFWCLGINADICKIHEVNPYKEKEVQRWRNNSFRY